MCAFAQRVAAFLLLACLLQVTSANAADQAVAPTPLAAITDLSQEAQSKVDASIRAFEKRSAPAATRDAGDLGWDCLAAIALVEAGDKQAATQLRAISKVLSDKVLRRGTAPAGWPYQGTSANSCPNGGLDAFGDGTCNGPDTVYSFQTGLGIACLAKAGALLNDRDLITTASQVMDYWQGFMLADKPCKDCAYYLYSDNPNDRGRYVRNVNLFMAFGAAALASATGDKTQATRARQVIASELNETASGNMGYLGRLDRQWIAKRAEASQNIENHAAAMAVLADQIGVYAALPEARKHGQQLWQEWAMCDNKRCQVADCKVWGGDPLRCQATLTAAHCAFRSVDPRARAKCEEYLTRVKILPTFGIWSVVAGGRSN